MIEEAFNSPIGPMSEAEFEAWCTSDTRSEFVDGFAFRYPSATLTHARLVGFLVTLLGFYLELSCGGELFAFGFQARLRPGLRRAPDLFYLSPEQQAGLEEFYFDGAPHAVWEIVSEESVERDWREKYDEYESTGVIEYWLIDPLSCNLRLYRLTDGRYDRVDPEEGRLCSKVIPGFQVQTDWFWQSPLPTTSDCVRKMGMRP